MVWIVKLVSIGAAGVERSTEVMRIARPDDLTDLATLGLDLLRKSGEFPISYEELDDPAATVYEGV